MNAEIEYPEGGGAFVTIVESADEAAERHRLDREELLSTIRPQSSVPFAVVSSNSAVTLER